MLINQQILLVEDSSLDAMLFERTLQLNGFEGNIKVCSTIADAVNYLELHKGDSKNYPSLIVLDMFLNGDCGVDILDYLANQPSLNLDVVVVTASKALINEEEVISNSYVKKILDKPFNYLDFEAVFNKTVA